MSAPRLNDVREGDIVFAYKNLTRGCWSLKALSGPRKGRVVAHLDTLTLHGASPKVSAAQLAWMRAHGSRLVCAGIIGAYAGEHAALWGARIRFAPFERDGFFYPDTGGAFEGAPVVTFGPHGDVYAQGVRS